VQSPSSQSGHQTSDGLEIWRISHIPQKDGELDSNEHHEKFSLYCKDHECPCCGICMVEIHRDCVDVSILKNIVKDVKTSDLFNACMIVWFDLYFRCCLVPVKTCH
jgi:hypothetical protein